MAVKTYGDIAVEASADTINSPAVKHYLQTVFPSYQARANPLSNTVGTIPIMGEEAQWPRDHGSSAFRLVDRLGDRTPRFMSTRQTRVKLTYQAFDLDFAVKEDSQVLAMLNQVDIIRDKIMSAAARLEFMITYNALRSVRSTDSSPEAADGVLATIPSTIKWDPINKVLNDANTTPQAWNLQKMAHITTTRRMGNIDGPVMFVARADSVHGLYEDEQSVNADYQMLSSAVSELGLSTTLDGKRNYWAIVGQFPPDLDGNAQGVAVDRVTRGSGANEKEYYIADEYAFDPRCLIMTTSPETPKFYTKIYRNEDHKELRFRASMYCGCGVINPKGIIRIKNAIRLQ